MEEGYFNSGFDESGDIVPHEFYKSLEGREKIEVENKQTFSYEDMVDFSGASDLNDGYANER